MSDFIELMGAINIRKDCIIAVGDGASPNSACVIYTSGGHALTVRTTREQVLSMLNSVDMEKADEES